MYPDVSLTIAKIDSIPPENSGYVRADGDHKRILRFHQSATAHWLWATKLFQIHTGNVQFGRTVQLHGPKLVSTENPFISKIKQIGRWVASGATHDRESVNMWRRLARERRESTVIPTFLDHTNDSIDLALKQ